MQLDLIKRPDVRIAPESGRSEPRLWVRRLVIWSAPGVVLRDIELRRGLNVIWSPDPADRRSRSDAGTDEAGPPGHGAGKTLVCRLLRYCLGEPEFAPKVQHERIAIAFKEGRVGAEVVVDGVVWAVVRSIGILARDMAVEGGSLETVVLDDGPATGISAFVEIVQRKILTDEVSAVVGEGPSRAWLTALAWLTRDQECRFDAVTDWRSASSDSRSPARGLSRTGTLTALRALVGAISPKEHTLQADAARLDEERGEAAREAERHRWAAQQLVSRVAKVLELKRRELPDGALVVDVLRSSARARLAQVVLVSGGPDPSGLAALDAAHEAARSEVERLAKELAVSSALADAGEETAKMTYGEMPGLSYAVDDAEMQMCPVCEVPIDRALAQQCKLSHKMHDVESLRARRDRKQRELDAAVRSHAQHGLQRDRLAAELGPARQRATEAKHQADAARRVRDAREEAWYGARRVGDEVGEVERHLAAETAADAKASRLGTALEKKREQVGTERDAHARVFDRVSQLFDQIVRKLLGSAAVGRVALDGNGLHLTVELGGDRSTPAIESVKVLAFDLAAMCVSIEGRSRIPAFLVHDSPREADMGLSVYHRVFEFALELEAVGAAPLFQYFITTTTRPPDQVCDGEWLVLTLEGAPAEKRLLGRDL